MSQAVITRAMLWQGFVSEVVESLTDTIGMTSREADSVRNLPQDFSTYAGRSVMFNNGSMYGPQYWVRVTPYGYVSLGTVSRLTSQQRRDLAEAQSQLNAAEKRYHSRIAG